MKNKLVVAGAGGRMGQALVSAIVNSASSWVLYGAFTRVGSHCVGAKVGQLGREIPIVDDACQALQGSNYLIDFTSPDASIYHIQLCEQLGVGVVLGTTGFSSEQRHLITRASHHIPIVMAPNMSVGVHLVLSLLKMAAASIPDSYDIEIVEAHHRLKVDAPSGTALKMGEVIAQAKGRQLSDCAEYCRHGSVGPRPASAIGFSAIRGGDIVGDHTVMFCGLGERIEISHKSFSRISYASGALLAAEFLQSKTSGLFSMEDVLSRTVL